LRPEPIGGFRQEPPNLVQLEMQTVLHWARFIRRDGRRDLPLTLVRAAPLNASPCAAST
jgi:hypothetical protein